MALIRLANGQVISTNQPTPRGLPQATLDAIADMDKRLTRQPDTRTTDEVFRGHVYAHLSRTTTSMYGTQAECKAARDALQRLLDDPVRWPT